MAAIPNRRKGLTEPRQTDTSDSGAVAGHYDPDFAQVLEEKLQELAHLPPNWDGYGAPPINPDIIAAASNFIRSLPENLACRPKVVPMSTGNLQLEWHHGSKILELEWESPQTIRYLQWHPEREVEEEDTFGVSNVEKAVDLIHWFMSGTFA